jgi:uncharacterized protein YbaP (TraB family)
MAPRPFPRLSRFVIGLLLAALAFAACAADLHSLWAVKGERNTVYVLGSVHLLRSTDGGIPAEALRAYANAKAVVMEMDPTDLPKMATALLAGAALPPGQTLSGILGAELHAKFAAHARSLGVDPDFLNRFQPWFAVTLLEQMKLARLGYDPDIGIDRQLARRADSDGKRIIGLETMEEQVGLLAGLSLEQQRSFVADSLGQLDDSARVLEVTLDAWRRGDIGMLERTSLEAFKTAPEVYQRLLVDRNRRWVERIAEMLKDRDDYLVVVGVLHLAGRDSVIELLQRKGFAAVQQ